MLLTSQNLFSDSPSSAYSSLCNLYRFSSRNSTLSLSVTTLRHRLKCLPSSRFEILKVNSLTSPEKLSSFSFTLHPHAHQFHRLKAYESPGAVQNDVVAGDFNLDSLLSLVEFCCLLSSTIVSVGFAVNSIIVGSKKGFLAAIGNSRVTPWGILTLVAGVLIGSWIRRRQWRRICGETVKGGLEVNLLRRVEKLEEDLRSSVTVIRVLSRQLEKLGIRFRVTRQALKDPITETAALAQKNSEATRALAVQADILEKELGEIQKVLLAMQEQQQKQLDLILAIGKTGKLWESKRGTSEEQDILETSNSAADEVKQKEVHQI